MWSGDGVDVPDMLEHAKLLRLDLRRRPWGLRHVWDGVGPRGRPVLLENGGQQCLRRQREGASSK